MALNIAGGSLPAIKPASGRWIGPVCNGYGSSTFGVDGRQFYHPLVVWTPTSYDRIGINVGTAGAVSTVIRLGIYTNLNGKPSSLLLDAGTVVGDATGEKTITITQTLGIGLYWLCAQANGGTPLAYGPGAGNYIFTGTAGFTDTTAAAVTGWRFDTNAGALTASAPAVSSTANGGPSAFLRVA